MKKINLITEIVIVSNSELSEALSSNREFAITVKGEVKYTPFEATDMFIYKGKITPEANADLSIPKPLLKQELLGKHYQVVEDGDRVLIKAGAAWQDIIALNTENCHYDDTTGDGIDVFKDTEMEDMGWKVTDFDVTYRTLVEMLEEEADITLLCYEQEEPYQFSGLGYFNDLPQAREILFNYCRKTIRDKLATDPDYAEDMLDDDQEEAMEFFKIK